MGRFFFSFFPPTLLKACDSGLIQPVQLPPPQSTASKKLTLFSLLTQVSLPRSLYTLSRNLRGSFQHVFVKPRRLSIPQTTSSVKLGRAEVTLGRHLVSLYEQ